MRLITTMRSAALCIPLLLPPGSSASASAATAAPHASAGMRAAGAKRAPAVLRITSSSDIRFTENRGQIADTEGRLRPDVKFIADAAGARLYFMPGTVSHVFSKTTPGARAVSEATGAGSADPNGLEPSADTRTTLYRMDMTLVGCNPDARMETGEELSGRSNYYHAHCPSGITGVRSFRSITYRNIYDHIDLVYTSSMQRVKYEFVVHPGGNPKDILLRYEGAVRTMLDDRGGLNVETPIGALREDAPWSYQHGSGTVTSDFTSDDGCIGFNVGTYDTRQDLVIDPWVTYFGGSGNEFLYSMTVDGNGAYLFAGTTYSTDFPVSNAWQGTKAGAEDICVIKLSPTQSLLWSTYYGGTSSDGAAGIAAGANGLVAVNGYTSSTSFPVTTNAYQPAMNGSNDACVVVLDVNGTRVWASYLGGTTGFTLGTDVTFDGNNNLYLVGSTTCSDFPTTGGAFQSVHGGLHDVFLTCFSTPSSPTVTMQWSTYMGSPDYDYGLKVTCNSTMLVIHGQTNGSAFPVSPSAYQSAIGGGTDTYVAAFTLSGGLLWSTYFGGSAGEYPADVAIDASGNCYITGETASTNFPVSSAFQSANAGSTDLYIAKLTSTGGLSWSTYYGGGGSETHVTGVRGYAGVAVDGNGAVYIVGESASTDFPVYQAVQSTLAGGFDAVFLKFSSSGSREWATYYGGTAYDHVAQIAVDASGNLVACGFTYSTNFPLLNPLQSANGGGTDGFIVQMTTSGYIPVEISSLSARRTDDDVTICWVTESETNNAGFHVECMVGDDATWHVRGFVPGAGSTMQPRQYAFTDDIASLPQHGMTLRYRLRQVDLDGRESLSPVVDVAPGGHPLAFEIAAVYPSPAQKGFQIELTIPEEQDVQLAVYDALGTCVHEMLHRSFTAAGRHVFTVQPGTLRPGVYYLRATGQRGAAVRSLVIAP